MYLTAQPDWKTSQQVLKEAGKRGSNVHDGTELLEQGRTLLRDSYTLEEWQMLECFVRWYQEHEPKIIQSEVSVVSDKLKTGGTIDRVYDINGEIILLDIKTSGAIYENYWAQTGAYAKIFEENKNNPLIDKTAILRLAPRKKSGYEYVTHGVKDFKEDFKIFEATKKLWNHINPDAKPKILEVPETLSLSIITKEEEDQLTYEKRLEEAEQADRNEE
jgi:hypothetical protein